MTSLELAIEKDAAGELIEAAQYFEKSIEVEGKVESYLNLAFLYFQFNDFGFNSSSGYPAAFKKTAFERLDSVIDEAIRRFPENSEARFLKLCFEKRILGYSLSEAEVLKFVAEENSSLVPYFYLYIFNGDKYKK